MKDEYRYVERGFRLIFGVLIPCGTIVEKWNGECWVYVDTIPPGEKLK